MCLSGSLFTWDLLGGGTAEIGSKACATCLVKKCQEWVGKMAKPLRALAAKPDDTSLTLGTYIVEGENIFPQAVL